MSNQNNTAEIDTAQNDVDIRTTIKKNDWGEWVVRLFVDGEHLAAGDYFASDRADALETAERMKEHATTCKPKPATVRIRSSIVTGNGWIPDLKEGEKRRQYEADLDWKQSRSLGIAGSPLGRGWTEEEAKADLIARVMHESGIRLELKDPTVWAVYYDTPRAFGIVREVSPTDATEPREGQCEYVYEYDTEAKALAHLELLEKREMLKGDGITQLISDKLGIDIEMPPHLSRSEAAKMADDFEDIIFHSINKKIDELIKEVDA
jgi:hypothetical protein